jgi:hypothetical protein
LFTTKKYYLKVFSIFFTLYFFIYIAGKIGNIFADKTGFNQVADANNIIILYPQATSSILSNPNGINTN